MNLSVENRVSVLKIGNRISIDFQKILCDGTHSRTNLQYIVCTAKVGVLFNDLPAGILICQKVLTEVLFRLYTHLFKLLNNREQGSKRSKFPFELFSMFRL